MLWNDCADTVAVDNYRLKHIFGIISLISARDMTDYA